MVMVPEERVNNKIFIIRGQKVILDRDLAILYGVPTMRLNESVRRNINRFPEDFMFQLTREETKNWISQIAISNPNLKMGLRKLPLAFTEHGVTMLASVLKSERAVQMSLFIVRAFIKMREFLFNHKDLANKIDELERKQKEQGDLLTSVYSVVKQLINEPTVDKDPIGFRTEE